ncbi:hypothetical protein V500_01951 [Pseudogymnoascus sp. VKM F-4518 (FW-2643)]|nr:hypothetical protein V500_01951 [Pseudogymnoascus sp. VKM F-4518 (FW-2643)]
MCAVTRKGAREASRAERSSARSRILTDPTARTSMLKGLVAIAKSSLVLKAQSSEGVTRGVALRSVHVPLRVFSCGEAEKGDPLGGAIMQCGGGGGGQASHDERSRCEKVGREERRWRGTVGGEGVALL